MVAQILIRGWWGPCATTVANMCSYDSSQRAELRVRTPETTEGERCSWRHFPHVDNIERTESFLLCATERRRKIIEKRKKQPPSSLEINILLKTILSERQRTKWLFWEDESLCSLYRVLHVHFPWFPHVYEIDDGIQGDPMLWRERNVCGRMVVELSKVLLVLPACFDPAPFTQLRFLGRFLLFMSSKKKVYCKLQVDVVKMENAFGKPQGRVR